MCREEALRLSSRLGAAHQRLAHSELRLRRSGGVGPAAAGISLPEEGAQHALLDDAGQGVSGKLRSLAAAVAVKHLR